MDTEAPTHSAAEVEWNVPSHATVDDIWSHLTMNVNELCDAHVPLKKPGRLLKRPPWFDKDLRALLTKRKRAWKAFVSLGDQPSHTIYKNVRNQCKKLLRYKRMCYEQGLLENGNAQPKRLFAYINRRRKINQSTPPLIDSQGNEVTEDHIKAEVLADHFFSVYNSPAQSIRQIVLNGMADCPDGASPDVLHDVDFSVEDVERALRRLNTQKAPGPDGIHPLVLKTLSAELAPVVHQLFRKSLDTAALPAVWKQGLIRPFPKPGDPTQPANYRPVCMTAILVKLMESFVKDAIDKHLDHTGVVLPQQHGFVRGKSCTTNLLLAREEWCEARERRKPVHTVFIDFSKAFDRVDHELLLHKLLGLKIRGKVLSWIASYLTDRSWRVRLQSHLSSTRPGPSRVL